MDHRRDPLTELFDTFSTNLAASGGIARRAGSAEDAAGMVREIATDGFEGTAWIPSSLASEQQALAGAITDAGFTVEVATDPATVRDQPLGITLARLAIAETGSVLLHEPEIADRSVSLMTETLIVFCPERSLVPSLDDAAGALREIATSGPSYSTFVTGPSRTADIERQLTIGVQGPSAMHVIFVPETTERS